MAMNNINESKIHKQSYNNDTKKINSLAENKENQEESIITQSNNKNENSILQNLDLSKFQQENSTVQNTDLLKYQQELPEDSLLTLKIISEQLNPQKPSAPKGGGGRKFEVEPDIKQDHAITQIAKEETSTVHNIDKVNQETALSEECLTAMQLVSEEVGTKEATGNNDGDILKYGGKEGDAWCASFMSWAYGSAQGTDNKETFGSTIRVNDIKERAIEAGYYGKVGEYTPVPGDIFIQQEGVSHTGMVVKVDDNYIYTIEGNADDAVTARKYNIHGEKIHRMSGYVKMNEWYGIDTAGDLSFIDEIEFADADIEKGKVM